MKKILIVILMLLFTLVLSAKQLKDFESLMDALKQGEDPSVVIHYGQCKLMIEGEERSAPDAIGGMPIEVWEYFAPQSIGNPQAFVVFSQTKLINLGGYIYNYVKFKISEDGSVVVTAQYVHPLSYETEMDEDFVTEINNGKNEGALFIYKD